MVTASGQAMSGRLGKRDALAAWHAFLAPLYKAPRFRGSALESSQVEVTMHLFLVPLKIVNIFAILIA